MQPNQQGNPFAELMSKFQQNRQAPQQAPAQPPMPPQAGGQGQEDVPNQLNPGDEGGNSSMLVGALQQMQKYISAETQPEFIQIARSISILLTKLIEKDHDTQLGKLSQDQSTAGQQPMGQ